VANNWNALTDSRRGVMLHYDASRSDTGAVAWLTRDPRCRVAHEVAPVTARAWHAGVCRTSDSTRLPYRDANSVFYGLAIAATDGDTATPAQIATVVRLTREAFARHHWPLSETWRIVGHSSEAWPRGRKHDPEGSHPDRPVMDVARIRAEVAGAP
jgi:N-acetyl-anhydromuramyl-L-alanine amidase AmpD